ncbi:hypothetical protein SDC9_176141 [bioreactor metagenome]|uniref:Uncharacterized protein n=1 Tax=bioreactor metagenome TaxID=1076179 RepID=A0A645GR87_9ZZZZ
MLGADIGMVQELGLLLSQCQDLFHPGRVGNVADHLLIGASANLLLDLHPDNFQIKAQLLEHIDGYPLPKFDQP